MRVKLQLVLCSDDGHEETVTDIVSWKKDSHRIEHLGLTLAESKQLLKRIQKKLLQQQIQRYLETHAQCLAPSSSPVHACYTAPAGAVRRPPSDHCRRS